MRCVLAVVLILSAGPAARADGSAASACRLSPAECAVVLHEVAVDADLFVQDQQIVGVGLSPRERAKALIQRDTDRMATRFRHLPAPIAAEVARVQACRALGDAAGLNNSTDPDPRCG